MLKSSTGKLYTLLAACKPDNAKVKKRLIITEIMKMPEYKALQVYQGAASAMDDHYGPDRLQAASVEQLIEIKKIIPFMEDCIRKLYEVICYGDIRELFGLKKIRFYDAESMRNVYDIVRKQSCTGVNITNIPEFDVWSVFYPETIRSLDGRMNLFNASDIDSIEMEITDKLKNYTYCISSAEIAERRREYLDIYRKEETVRLRLQIVENKIFMKKIIFSIAATIIVLIQFLNSADVMNPWLRGVFLALYIIALMVYWIKG